MTDSPYSRAEISRLADLDATKQGDTATVPTRDALDLSDTKLPTYFEQLADERQTSLILRNAEANTLLLKTAQRTMADHAVLRHLRARNADLSESNFSEADLYSADLSNANLRASTFREANLTDASLCEADLRSATLTHADLSGANLMGANLQHAYLGGAKLSSSTKLPAPTMLLSACWGSIAGERPKNVDGNELVRDLQAFDAACHPHPEAFSDWADGSGDCPYDSRTGIERAAHFCERSDLWDPDRRAPGAWSIAARLLLAFCELPDGVNTVEAVSAMFFRSRARRDFTVYFSRTVTVERTEIGSVTVRAQNEDEARSAAWDEGPDDWNTDDEDEIGCSDPEVTSVDED